MNAEAHAVYPDGPPCNPHCPGEHSMYHDGYADGYENGENAAAEAVAAGLRANPGMASAVRAALTETEECPTCGMVDSHVVLGHETIPDHRWKQP